MHGPMGAYDGLVHDWLGAYVRLLRCLRIPLQMWLTWRWYLSFVAFLYQGIICVGRKHGKYNRSSQGGAWARFPKFHPQVCWGYDFKTQFLQNIGTSLPKLESCLPPLPPTPQRPPLQENDNWNRHISCYHPIQFLITNYNVWYLLEIMSIFSLYWHGHLNRSRSHAGGGGVGVRGKGGWGGVGMRWGCRRVQVHALLE